MRFLALLVLQGQAAMVQDAAEVETRSPGPELGMGVSVESVSLRGVYFNPQVKPNPEAPWLVYYDEHRGQIRASLEEMVSHADLNLSVVFLPMPHSLAKPKTAPRPGQSVCEWANMAYLDNVAQFVDDCHEAGVSVAFDMANNMWVPHSVDTANRVVGVPDQPPGTDPWWPIADSTPWDESRTWYAQIIEYVEGKCRHPEGIAWWCMGGNHALGCAEPVLWDNNDVPAIKTFTETFVKEVWPAFRAAGKRPKAAPYVLPIFSRNAYWMGKTPEERLSGCVNLKKWLVNDLELPPDYWPISSYPFCDPAPDGFYYLRGIVEVLGEENAARIISTDFKGSGHEDEMIDCIIDAKGASGGAILDWHFAKCAEYGFGGWWIWAYQDTVASTSGIRDIDGRWKGGLIHVIKNQAQRP